MLANLSPHYVDLVVAKKLSDFVSLPIFFMKQVFSIFIRYFEDIC